ncbi:hypothetical protein C8T65DRAFT_648290 [Cerioporus squamosus]|nr:hypothetical protein C8T65DRAFT_648290 [Cerioporus squamosus]
MADNPSAEQAASNSLGLDLEALKIKDDPDSGAVDAKDESASKEDACKSLEGPADAKGEDDESSPKKETKEKKKPYVNPDRVKTGGAQREKLSEEELAERMVRIREQNEKIKQRRQDVQADEDEYKKKQEADRAKLAKAKKVQENVDKAREQNARRKLDKIQSREWDSGKPARSEWNKSKKDETGEDSEKKVQQSIGIRGAVRGGGRGGGRGRGRGGGVTSPTSEKKEQDATPTGTTTTENPTPAESAAASA